MAAAATPAPGSRWLHGRAADLLLGCGLWYGLAFGLFVFWGGEIRAGGGRVALPFLVLLLSTPHYGATLLRAYEQPGDRRAYRFFTLWVTAFLFAAFAAGTHSVWIGSLLVTLYLTWSPWHYTGQNYGLTVLFLRRRGIDLPPHVKRWLYASFLLSYVLTFLAIHSGAPADGYTPVPPDAGTYRFLSLDLPTGWARGAFVVTALGYGGSLLTAALLLLRRARAVELAPAAALAGTQALWFSAPVLLRHLQVQPGVEPWASDGAYYFLWIALAHAVQYLWVTSYHARASGPWPGMGRYLAKALAAGALAWTLPALLFAPGLLGRTPYGAGLALLVAAVVNLQHFALDGAIWKLRDGRVARVLLRPRDPAARSSAGPPRWAGRLVWAAAGTCAAIMMAAVWERHVGVEWAAARGDLERMARGVERLHWLGRDLPDLRVALARAHLGRGDTPRALEQLGRVLALHPTGDAWFVLANVYKQQRHWGRAVEAYQKAVDLQPEAARVHYELGLAWMELKEPARARDAFERAVALEPERGIYAVLRDRAQAASAPGP